MYTPTVCLIISWTCTYSPSTKYFFFHPCFHINIAAYEAGKTLGFRLCIFYSNQYPLLPMEQSLDMLGLTIK